MMNTSKLKSFLLTACCFVVALCSGIKSMEDTKPNFQEEAPRPQQVIQTPPPAQQIPGHHQSQPLLPSHTTHVEPYEDESEVSFFRGDDGETIGGRWERDENTINDQITFGEYVSEHPQ